MAIKPLEKCPVCNSDKLVDHISIINAPVFCNVFLNTETEALNAPKGDIQLASCSNCKHVFNRTFDASLLDYSGDYDCSLHYSGSFQAYAKTLSEDLINRHEIFNKTIVEIACGKGDFLSSLCKLGDNKGIGFDPSYEEGRLDEELTQNITFIRDYYSDKYSHLEADLLCCRHALEHIETPTEFLKTIWGAIGERSESSNNNCILFFEMPSVLYIIKEMGVWDIIYEHCGYFCKNSLSKAFQLSGFMPQKLDNVYGNQYLTIEAIPSSLSEINAEPISADDEQVEQYLAAFPKQYDDKVTAWKARLESAKNNNERVVVWGAGSKGVTFLNILGVTDEVGFIVDLNPHKQGKFVPGTGHKVVSPEFLREYQPTMVIVMNPVYTEEIKQSLLDMNITADVVEG